TQWRSGTRERRLVQDARHGVGWLLPHAGRCPAARHKSGVFPRPALRGAQEILSPIAQTRSKAAGPMSSEPELEPSCGPHLQRDAMSACPVEVSPASLASPAYPPHL